MTVRFRLLLTLGLCSLVMPAHGEATANPTATEPTAVERAEDLAAAVAALAPDDLSAEAENTRFSYAVLLTFRLERNFAEALALLEPMLLRLVQDPAADQRQLARLENAIAIARFGDGQDPETRALPLARASLDRLRAIEGDDSDTVLNRRTNLAGLYFRHGRADLAEPEMREILRLWRSRDPEGRSTTHAQIQLVVALSALGKWDEAETLIREAIAIRERTSGPDHPDVAYSLGQLALILFRTGRVEQVPPLMERILANHLANLGPDATPTLTARHNLASTYQRLGRFAEAETLVREDLERARSKAAPGWHEVAEYQRKLGEIALQRGQPDRALPELLAAADAYSRPAPDGVWRESLSRELEGTLRSLALAQHAAGDLSAARSSVDRWLDAMEEDVRRHLGYTSEKERIALLADRRPFDLPAALGFPDQLARATARLKGLVLDSIVEDAALAATQGDPEVTALLDRYRRALAAPQPTEDLESLEKQLTVRLGGFTLPRTTLQVDPAALLQALPAGTALVDFVRHARPDLTTLAAGEEHYAALVGTAEDGWQLVPLGTAVIIDEAVARYQILTRQSGPLAWAQELRRLALDPVRAVLPAAIHTLCLVPDSALHHVNFGTLPEDDERHFVLHRHRYVWLNAARDLLRPANPVTPRGGPPRVLAAPAVDPEFAALPALPGARQEAVALLNLWPDTEVWTSAEATPDHALQLPAPRLLHVAAHGWTRSAGAPAAGGIMQRSGIVLAGPEGFLTAARIAATDLRETSLAVLSSCDSGGGTVVDGEGVLGLRRALARAGVERTVLSLWPLDDEVTARWMQTFYARLAEGQEPLTAFDAATRLTLSEQIAHDGAASALRRAGALILVGRP